jgi:DNA mismatch repair protein PMS2
MGYISKSEKASGRSAKDRQYLYVNKRPIQALKISRAINDIYRQFHGAHPVYILNIIIPSGTAIYIFFFNFNRNL